MATTQDVLNHHLESFGAGDLDGILSDYASDAVLFTPNGPFKGPDAIKPLFEGMLAEFAKPGASFEMKEMAVDGCRHRYLCHPRRENCSPILCCQTHTQRMTETIEKTPQQNLFRNSMINTTIYKQSTAINGKLQLDYETFVSWGGKP